MEYSLVDKLFGKPFVVVKDVLGRKIEYRVLSNPDRIYIWKQNPISELLFAPETVAIPTLARSVLTIDNIPWDEFKEIKELQIEYPKLSTVELVEKHLSNKGLYPFTVINEMYLAYNEVVDAHQTLLENLKKNLTVPNPEPSGSSVVPSTEPQ